MEREKINWNTGIARVRVSQFKVSIGSVLLPIFRLYLPINVINLVSHLFSATLVHRSSNFVFFGGYIFWFNLILQLLHAEVRLVPSVFHSFSEFFCNFLVKGQVSAIYVNSSSTGITGLLNFYIFFALISGSILVLSMRYILWYAISFRSII